jgi:peptide-methionine (S)-S-oxide reductase
MLLIRSRYNTIVLTGLLCALLLLFSEVADAQTADSKTAVFAGGCFWCMEPPFDKLDGVISTISGYTGGHLANPTYRQVTAGGTGHLESVQITYDPKKVNIETLLETFWANIDPVDSNGQFCDRGESYTTAIFYSGEDQEQAAQHSKSLVTSHLGRSVVTKIIALEQFYPAEDYHQDYYMKNPGRYKFYRWNCGRDSRLEDVWGENAGERVALFD